MPTTAPKQVIELIKRSNKILILASSPADGDSIGSAIALYMSFKKLKKDATVVCKDAIPELFKFLPNMKVMGNNVSSTTDFVITLDCKNTKVKNIKSASEDDKINIIITPKEGRFSEENVSYNKGKADFDLIITVDCAELNQLGDIYENNIELFHQIPVINIDHHISNTHFGKINHVDIMASSTTELLLPILEEISREENINLIDEDIATLLLTGIITDTGSFQNANTTPKSFAVAAQLISYGARQQEIIQHIYKTKQLSQLKLWGRILSKIQTDDSHKIVWSVVTQQDFRDTESTEEQTGDVIDELMTNAPGAEVILLIKERKNGDISVSIRTTTSAVDASKIAENFGGGGHTRASGFTIKEKNTRDVENEVIAYVQNLQKDTLGIMEEETKESTERKEEEMINVKELMARAEKAQKATEVMKKVENKVENLNDFKPPVPKEKKKEQKNKDNKKTSTKFKFKSPEKEEKKSENPPEKPEPSQDSEIIYKFED